jgi:GNAT superfamily N-acetyltransferase
VAPKVSELVIETYPPPVFPAVALTPDQERELEALNRIMEAGDGVLRIGRLAGQGVGRALVFLRVTAAVEKAVLGASAPGFAGRLRRERSALLTDLVVAEEHRGRGIGRLLVRDALAVAAAAGCARLTLEVRRDNAPALRIYRELGFIIEDDPGEVATVSRSAAR